jgi:hypothetical protein
MIRRILALAAGFLVVMMLGGWGHNSPPTGPQQAAAAGAVRALTSDAPDAADRLPADFPTVMGYRPVLVAQTKPAGATPAGSTAGSRSAVVEPAQAEPTRADGSCSSPFGGTLYHFTGACRQHDLGYDLLRYANRKGQPLGPWARRAVDDSFARHTRTGCHQVGCATMANFYIAVVRFNTWRQGYGVPVREQPVSAFAVPIAGGLLTAGLLGLLSRRRSL